MKSKLLILFACLMALAGHAADERVTLRITITNLPVTGNALTFTAPAAKVITWTNTRTAVWVDTNTTVNLCATNLFLQMAAFAPWTPRPALLWANTNAFDVVAEVNQAIAVTASGTWATLTLSTQTVTRLTTVRVPISSEVGDTNRTNVASLLVKGINDHSTNALGSNSIALAHALQLNTNTQRALGRKRFDQLDTSTNITTIYGGTNDGVRITNSPGLHGSNVIFFNGYETNIRSDNLISSNLFNYGNAISSKNTNGAGEQFGLLAIANGIGSALAVGAAATASGEDSTALGSLSVASGDEALALGNESAASGADSAAVGTLASASKSGALALGNQANAGHTNSVALGASATTDADFQIMLGSSSVAYVKAFGRLNAGSLTNTLFTGTNMNRGEWADSTVTVTSLANGNNIAVAGSNAVVRLAAGPTAAFAICGIQGGYDGRRLEIWNDTGQAMTIANQSGLDPTAANRIITTTGADLVLGTNAWVSFRYFGDRSRWVTRRTD